MIIDYNYKRAEFGYWLLPIHWGKGIMAEAGTSVITYCFNELKLNKIFASVETMNHTSAYYGKITFHA